MAGKPVKISLEASLINFFLSSAGVKSAHSGWDNNAATTPATIKNWLKQKSRYIWS